MRVEVRRSRRGTWSALINLILTAGAGVVLTGNALVRAEPSRLGLVVGALMLVWSLVILSGVLRPVLLAADGRGLSLRRVFGTRRIGWDDLLWVDFETSARMGLVAGRQGLAGFSLRAADPQALAAALAAIRAARPDLPTRNPDIKEAA